jgi:glycosyltransferase involved in cell wall biosynthesis
MIRLISIIAPMYNEQENVSPFLQALRETMEAAQLPFEVVLVDDGSRDDTFQAIKEEAARDSRVKGLSFRRNFGQTTAIRAGFDYVTGDISITMDGDLQHSPEYIPQFVQKIEEGYDLVCSYRVKRSDGFLRRFPSKVANILARRLSTVKVRDFGSTYRAYRTDVIRDIPIYGEMHRFIPVFVNMVSNRITEIPVPVKPRLHGRSKYGLGRTFRVISDLLVLLFFSGFFSRPSHIFGYIALMLGLPGFAILSWLGTRKLLWSIPIMLNGPLFMLGVLLCLVAVQLFTTGIVCEYLVRIYYNDARKSYSLADTTMESNAATEDTPAHTAKLARGARKKIATMP